jgi:hypothetical protein
MHSFLHFEQIGYVGIRISTKGIRISPLIKVYDGYAKIERSFFCLIIARSFIDCVSELVYERVVRDFESRKDTYLKLPLQG